VALELSVSPTVEALRPIRVGVRKWLTEEGYSGADIDGVLLVVSELVTNGIIHDGGDNIEVRVGPYGTRGVSIEVVTADRRPGDHPDHPRVVRDPSEAGRGLMIVGALTDELVVQDRNGRRHTACRMSFSV
jgi:anti-sigma regulatory factor (Ser/Thr protein kinase)